MSRPRGMRLSIRFKLLGLLAAVLLGAIGTYLVLAIRLMTEDRLTYAFDLNRAIVNNLSAQTHAIVDGSVERLLLYGEVVMRETDADARDALVERLLDADPDMVRVRFFLLKASRYRRVSEVAAANRLTPLELTLDDIAGLDESQPVPFDAVAAEGRLLLNRSLPPSAQLLTLAVAPRPVDRQPPPWIVAADMTQDRLLQIFSEREIYSAYLVDVDGVVLTHPDPDKVLSRARLADVPVVKAALDGRGAQSGALEFIDATGSDLLGAWAHVGTARLSVVSEVHRDTALAAARRLLRLSVLFGVGVVLAAFLLTIFFARRLTTPIRRLRDATSELASGRYDVDLKVDTRDEIGDLATDFRTMAREIRDAQTGLIQSEKMAAFGQLGAGITHEVKNPLSAIRGFAQLAQQFQEDKDQVNESLQLIERETNRCLEIVQNFLRFARADPGKRERVSPDDIVEQGVKIIAHQLSTSGVRLHTSYGDAPAVHGNAGQLQQVMLNLALNAEQAVGRGGNVWVATHRLTDGRAEIEVRDDGPGIPKEIQARIFEPFFTTKPAGQGTGLGLSVSYGIVQNHGGDLVVESEPGGGTTFRIRLPAAGVRQGRSRAGAAADPG